MLMKLTPDLFLARCGAMRQCNSSKWDFVVVVALVVDDVNAVVADDAL